MTRFNKSPEPAALALAIPLSRFTSRVSGGLAFLIYERIVHR